MKKINKTRKNDYCLVVCLSRRRAKQSIKSLRRRGIRSYIQKEKWGTEKLYSIYLPDSHMIDDSWIRQETISNYCCMRWFDLMKIA